MDLNKRGVEIVRGLIGEKVENPRSIVARSGGRRGGPTTSRLNPQNGEKRLGSSPTFLSEKQGQTVVNQLPERESNIVSCAGVRMALEQELATYKAKLSELRENEGKFVLIHGADVIDVFGTYEDAVREGYAKFKLEPFLVKRILSVEEVHFISRLLDPCHT